MKRNLIILDNIGSIYTTPENIDNTPFTISELHKKFLKKFKHVNVENLDNDILLIYGNDVDCEPWEYNSLASAILKKNVFSSIVIFVSKSEIKSPKKYSKLELNETYNNFYINVVSILKSAYNIVNSAEQNENIKSDADDKTAIKHIRIWSAENNVIDINDDNVTDFSSTYLENKFASYDKTNTGELILSKPGLIAVIENINDSGHANLFFTGSFKNTTIS